MKNCASKHEMKPQKIIVLDANILIRACLGSRVFELLDKYEEAVSFYSPDVCFADAERHVSMVLGKRGADSTDVLLVLEQLSRIVIPVDVASYQEHERTARKRIADRDPSDWPVVAAALFLRCPIWTEDRDFFGTGMPTWTTARVEEYLKDVQ